MREVTLTSGEILLFDEKKWDLKRRSIDYTCTIMREEGDYYILRDCNLVDTPVHKSIIKDNFYKIVDGQVTLSKSVYEHWMINSKVVPAEKRFQELFKKHQDLIFKNRDLVLTRAEYYKLSPKLLCSGGAYIGGFNYCLGILFERMNERNEHVYFEEVDGHRDCYLVALGGSPLSGAYNCTFWSDVDQKFFQADSSTVKLEGGFMAALKEYRSVVGYGGFGFAFQDIALINLLEELGS